MMFSLVQTSGIKLNPELSYMTAPERTLMKDMDKYGRLSVFDVKYCEANCGEYIPRAKRYCSVGCYQKAKGLLEDETKPID